MTRTACLACLAGALAPIVPFEVAGPSEVSSALPETAEELRPAEVVYSPDSRHFAFEVTRMDPSLGSGRTRIHLGRPHRRLSLAKIREMIRGSSNRPVAKEDRVLTRPEEDARAPQFSPDSKRLAFLSERGSEARTQVWALSLAGGEAEPLTSAAEDVRQFAWAEGGALYFLTGEDGTGSACTTRELWRLPAPAMNAANTAAEKLVPEKCIEEFSLSFDGRLAVLVVAERAGEAELWTLDCSSLEMRQLTNDPAHELSPRFSDDGAFVYYLAETKSLDEESLPGTRSSTRVFRVPATGGEPELVSRKLEGDVLELATCAESDRIFAVVGGGAPGRLFRIHPRTGNVFALLEDAGGVTSVAVKKNGEEALFTYSAEGSAPEIGRWSHPESVVEILTALNTEKQAGETKETGEDR